MVRSFHRLDVSMDKGMKVSNSSVCIYVYVCVGTRVKCVFRNVNPLQYSCLENPVDGGAW